MGKLTIYGLTQKHILDKERNRKDANQEKGKTSRQFRREASKQKDTKN